MPWLLACAKVVTICATRTPHYFCTAARRDIPWRTGHQPTRQTGLEPTSGAERFSNRLSARIALRIRILSPGSANSKTNAPAALPVVTRTAATLPDSLVTARTLGAVMPSAAASRSYGAAYISPAGTRPATSLCHGFLGDYLMENGGSHVHRGLPAPPDG